MNRATVYKRETQKRHPANGKYKIDCQPGTYYPGSDICNSEYRIGRDTGFTMEFFDPAGAVDRDTAGRWFYNRPAVFQPGFQAAL